MERILIVLLMSAAFGVNAQVTTNISCTNPVAQQVMKGQYDPLTYAATNVIDDHATILCELNERVSPDSLHAYLVRLESFGTRNSFSDTVSNTTGIGAARRWAYSKFQEFSAANEGRLMPAYLQFDYIGAECGPANGWRDVLAVLPGRDTSNASIVLVEAHLDSRCADNCDPTCYAPGMEDNGSGSALVMELARVMSRYTFDHTLVFMLTTAEEQGLCGAEAMATWCVDQGVAIKGVQNNDIVGGILCGYTSSPPSCPGFGDVDSLQVRLFSNGGIANPHRGFARTIKMFYQEKLQEHVAVPMTISIMNQEDRDGRGGDHIPFRLEHFRNMRFTSANESGNASVDSSWYVDRQHTSGDVLGVDTDGDLVVDSFFVDFNYLGRNVVINGMSMALMALGPEPPDFVVHDEPGGLRVSFTPAPGVMAWRVGVRNSSISVDFDAVYRTSDTSFVVPGLLGGEAYFISTAAIDSVGIMSPFSGEVAKGNNADTPPAPLDLLDLGISCGPIGVPELATAESSRGPSLSCLPNPFGDRTTIRVEVPEGFVGHEAHVSISDPGGREVARLPMILRQGTNEVIYEHRGQAGAYSCSLVVDGRVAAYKAMITVE